MAQGIEYLHEQGILVDNLNLHTILMNDRTDQAVPRISNFSHARILEPAQKVTDRSMNETLFLAPEICDNKPYDLKADCWAFGVILYFMLGSQNHIQCNEDEDDKELRKSISRYQFNEQPLAKRQKTSAAIDLVQRLLLKDPQKRLSMSVALRHAWFKPQGGV